MPIYEYRCTTCGEQAEILQKFSDAPKTHCDACNNETLQKQISAPSFHLKGNGWYVTDFKGDKKQPGTEKASAEPVSNATTSTKETTAASTDS